MYFQLEVYYYSNEANKNKYKNVQSIASTKNNLKIAIDCTGHCTRNDNLSYSVAWTCCCLKVYLQNLKVYGCLKVMFVSARYKLLYIYINTIYVNKKQHSCSSHLSPSLSFSVHKCGVSLLHGLIVASLRINKTYIKIDKVKTKSYLHQNHYID